MAQNGQFHTMLGTIQCERHYYLCPHCQTGQCPLDERLGVGANQMSALKSQLAAHIGVQLPFNMKCGQIAGHQFAMQLRQP